MGTLHVTVRNLDSMFSAVLGSYAPSSVDDVTHWARTKTGVGDVVQIVAPQMLIDLNPPAYEECYERFELHFHARPCESSSGSGGSASASSWWQGLIPGTGSWRDVGSLEVRRGHVVIFMGGDVLSEVS